MSTDHPLDDALPEYPPDPLDRLRFWAEYERILDDAVAQAVEDARAAGLYWQDIGSALGITAEGARIRHHRRMLKRVADGIDAADVALAR